MLRKCLALLAGVLLAVLCSTAVSAAEIRQNGIVFTQTGGTTLRVRDRSGASLTLENVLAVLPDVESGGDEQIVYVQSPVTYHADARSFSVAKSGTSAFNCVNESRYKLYRYTDEGEKGAFTGEIVSGGELLERGIVAPDNPVLEEKYWEIMPNRGSGVLPISRGEYVVMLSNSRLFSSESGWNPSFRLVAVKNADSLLVSEVVQKIPVPGEGTWEKVSSGKWRFRNLDGSLAAGNRIIGGRAYFFQNGYDDPLEMYEMRTGWAEGLWFQPDGSLKNGWVRAGDGWYYQELQVPGRYSEWDGQLKGGWLKTGGEWYYLDPYSGRMKTGWQKIGGDWYFLKESGSLYHGWLQWKGSWYYLNQGKMLTGCRTPDGYQVNADGVWMR